MTVFRRGAAVLLCALLGVSLCSCSEDGSAATGSDYKTVKPEKGLVEKVVQDTGVVAYRDPYAVIPLVNGKILSCKFEEGDTVKTGQILYTIDSTDLENQITQAELSLAGAEKSLSQSQRACYDLTVTSSASGSITAVLCHVGDYVGIGTPVAQVVDSANLTLTVPFTATAAAGMTPGTAAEISFQSYAERLSGTVQRVYETSSVITGGTQGVYVEIAFPNPGALASGTMAMASVNGASCMAAGPVAYATEQSIYASQSGKVAAIYVEAGDAVNKGEAVLYIENISLTSAATNAELAVETAQVSLDQLIAKRADYEITAPVGGIITARHVKLGDFAVAATPMATLAAENDMCVNVDIDEIYIEDIWSGQEAEVVFTADSGEQRSYAAKVHRVKDTGITIGGVTDYTVELELLDVEGLKSGMNVSVTIQAGRQENCLRIPSAALQGESVLVLKNGEAVKTPVTVGVVGGGYAEILSGLSETDNVILP